MPSAVPTKGWYVLADARLHWSVVEGLNGAFDRDGFFRADISIAHGRIKALAMRNDRPIPPRSINLAGRIILPAFIDCHTHLDKNHIWPRMPNPDGTLPGALSATEVDRMAFWTGTDVRRRIDFSLRCAHAYGTRAIRTHLDSMSPQNDVSWRVFAELREEWAGRMELQAASMIDIEALRNDDKAAVLANRLARTGGVFGAVCHMSSDLPDLLDIVFSNAAVRGLDVDLHADETGATDSTTLRLIAEAALRNRFPGKVLVSHCCAFALLQQTEVGKTLDLAARAGLSIVSLPFTSLYLQDRRLDQTTPRWRGATLAHEMKARGIPISIASGNARGPFHPYGDLDMLDAYRIATRIMHLDHPVDDWPRAVTVNPASAMGLDQPATIRAGEAADLVIFRGRSWSELLSRAESDRIVIRNGRAIDRRLPDYSELDDLAGGPA